MKKIKNNSKKKEPNQRDMKELKKLKKLVNMVFGLDIADKNRREPYLVARAVYYGIAKYHTNLSLSIIGEECNLDHSTVSFGIKKFRTLSQYPDYFRYINKCFNAYGMDLLGNQVIMNDDDLSKKIIQLQAQIEKLELGRNPIFTEINSLPEEKLKEFIEYRAKPFLRMNQIAS